MRRAGLQTRPGIFFCRTSRVHPVRGKGGAHLGRSLTGHSRYVLSSILEQSDNGTMRQGSPMTSLNLEQQRKRAKELRRRRHATAATAAAVDCVIAQLPRSRRFSAATCRAAAAR